MTCEQFAESGTIERYLAGKLSEAEQDAFEQHYFACERCFEAVRIMRATRQALLGLGPPAAQAAPVLIPIHRRRGVWAIAGIAAAIVAAIVLMPGDRSPEAVPRQLSQSAKPEALSPELQLLARIDPPAYEPQTLRGAESPSARGFQQAMAPYSAHDYSAAAAGLRKVLERDPASLDARYFLGICQLLTGNLDAGIVELHTVIAAGSISPYVEEAHFYLAKAYLSQGKLPQARSEFQTVLAQNGDLQRPAREILDHLPSK